MGWETTASGYAGVWATDNTREALWDAMQRKETYATTGPRMIVRFFGGWDFVANGREHAEPGSGRLSKGRAHGWRSSTGSPGGKSPTFLVAALKDPIGANLDRSADHQGLARCQRRDAREGLRCGLVGRPQA